MSEQAPFMIVFPRGQLDKKTKDRLTRYGILWLETDGDPKDVQQVRLSQPFVQSAINGDALITAALGAIARHQDIDTCRQLAVDLAHAAQAKKEASK